MHRILVVLPLYGGSLPIGRYCATALQEIGCLVDTFEAPDFYSAFTALKHLRVGIERLEFLENSFLQLVSQAILAKVEQFQPDLVLCLAQAPMSRQALKRLRKDGIPTAMWFVEDFRLFTYWRAFAPFYDIFAVIQKDPFLQELESIGVHNSLYLPMAAQPSFHKPLQLAEAERTHFGADLSFLGAGYPNRREAFVQLMQQGVGFKVWGTEWESEPRLAPLVQRQGERIAPEDAVRIYNATKINLNLHSSVHTNHLVSNGDFVNPRTFEVAACGAFQLVDQRSLMAELFTGSELAQFTSLEDLQNQIVYYQQRPEECAEIAQRARIRVLAEHTYAMRMQALLDFAKERLPNFGKTHADQAWPEDIPSELRAGIQELLQNLALPPTASFGDVVSAVRGKAGQLSDLETALLFLDEWKKLYVK